MEYELNDFDRRFASLEKDDIGDCVYTSDEISRELEKNVISICRRRFRKKDILLMVLNDEEAEGDSGMVFSYDCLFIWNGEGTDVTEIHYKDITGVDYESEYVIIYRDRCIDRFWCGENAEEYRYAQGMYNLISDVIELIKQK